MYRYVFHGNKQEIFGGEASKFPIVIRSFYVLPALVVLVVHVHASGLQRYITFTYKQKLMK